jgi:predicted amidohydrolase
VKKIAENYDSYIVFGMPELSEKARSTVYNTAVLVGPEGYIGKYRKMHLPTHSVFEEKRYFRPGYQAEAFETNLGKIGLIICYDIFFPEVCRLIRLGGAQIIVCISASPAVRRAFFETLTVARAIENTAFLAYVNLVGIEDGLQFWGGSRLIAPNGKIIAKAKYDEEDLVIGEVDYADIKPVETFVPTLKDLRPELFDKLKEKAETFKRTFEFSNSLLYAIKSLFQLFICCCIRNSNVAFTIRTKGRTRNGGNTSLLEKELANSSEDLLKALTLGNI